MKNKFLILSLMISGALPFNVLADVSERTDNGVTWSITNGVLSISADGAMPDYTTMGYTNGRYTSDAPWEQYHNEITSIEIANGVTHIGFGAFYDLSGATTVNIPSSVNSIARAAFYKTGLVDVVIPEGVTSIGYDAFDYSQSLQSIVLPSTLNTITGVDYFSKLFYGNTALQNVYCFSSQCETFASQTTSGYANKYRYGTYDLESGVYTYDDKNYTSVQNLLNNIQNYDKASDIPDANAANAPEKFSFYNMTFSKVPDGNGGYIYKDSDGNALDLSIPYGLKKQKNPDGSYTIFDADNNFIGYKGKRIYTVKEANQISGKKNKVTIRYR